MTRPARPHARPAAAIPAAAVVAMAVLPSASADGLAGRVVRGVARRADVFDRAARRLEWLRSEPQPGAIRGTRGLLQGMPLRSSRWARSRDQYGYFANRAARLAAEPLKAVEDARKLNLAPPLVELERALAFGMVAETFSAKARSPWVEDAGILMDAHTAIVEALDEEIRSASYHGEVQRVDRLIELLAAHADKGSRETFAHRVQGLLDGAVTARLELAAWGTKLRPGIVTAAGRRPPRFAATEGKDADHRELDSVRRGIDKLESLGWRVTSLRAELAKLERRPGASGGDR